MTVYTRRQIDWWWIEALHQEEPGAPMPTCQKCGVELSGGDFADGMYPWEKEYSVCAECEPTFGYAAAERRTQERDANDYAEFERRFPKLAEAFKRKDGSGQ